MFRRGFLDSLSGRVSNGLPCHSLRFPNCDTYKLRANLMLISPPCTFNDRRLT